MNLEPPRRRPGRLLTANKVTAGAAARGPDRRARELALREELVRGDFALVDRIPASGRPTLTAHRRDWYSVRFIRRDRWQPEYVNVSPLPAVDRWVRH